MPAESIRLVTVSTRSHLAQVAVLARSLARWEPACRLTCYLVERDASPADNRGQSFDVKPVREMAIPERETFCFHYPAFELCCALKPFAIADALRDPSVHRVVYLDGDCFVCAPFLDEVEKAWGGASTLLTPHLLKPWQRPEYRAFLTTGAFNAGFLAVRRAEESARFLAWLQARLQRECVRDVVNGLYVDQKWLDLATALPGVGVLRHPGINVGHWNVPERTFAADGVHVRVNGTHLLSLFHFSAFDPAGLTRHAKLDVLPPEVAALAAAYAGELAACRRDFPPDAPYTFGRFRDGSAISNPMREAVRRGLVACRDPFADKAAVLAALPAAQADVLLGHEPGQLAVRLAHAEAQLLRIRNHPVIGRVWRFWARVVNPALR